MQCFSGHHQIRMMKSDLAGQFAVLSLIDASFAADVGFSGLWSPITSFKGQIPTAGHLLQVAIKAIGQRVI